MGVFSDIGNFFSNMGTGIADTFSSADQDEIKNLCNQVLSLKERAQKFQGTLNVFSSELDKINALLEQVQQEIALAINTLEVPMEPMSIQAQRIQLTFNIGMSTSGLLFLGSWGAGRVVANNMNTLGELIESPMGVEMTAAEIAALNADIATTTTNILRATQIANVLKTLGTVTAVATFILTLIEEASFGEQMKNQIHLLQNSIATAKLDISETVKQLQTQKNTVLLLAAVVSGGLPVVSSDQTNATGIVVDPNNNEATSNVGQLMDDMVSLLTNIDEEENDYKKLQNQVNNELQQFNTVFPNCLTHAKAQLETLQSNIISAIKLLSYNVPATTIQQSLSLTTPVMNAIQKAMAAGVLTTSSTSSDFSLQLLVNDTLKIVPSNAASNPNAVVSTGAGS